MLPILLLIPTLLLAADPDVACEQGNLYSNPDKIMLNTDVRDQNRTGTCWLYPVADIVNYQLQRNYQKKNDGKPYTGADVSPAAIAAMLRAEDKNQIEEVTQIIEEGGSSALDNNALFDGGRSIIALDKIRTVEGCWNTNQVRIWLTARRQQLNKGLEQRIALAKQIYKDEFVEELDDLPPLQTKTTQSQGIATNTDGKSGLRHALNRMKGLLKENDSTANLESDLFEGAQLLKYFDYWTKQLVDSAVLGKDDHSNRCNAEAKIELAKLSPEQLEAFDKKAAIQSLDFQSDLFDNLNETCDGSMKVLNELPKVVSPGNNAGKSKNSNFVNQLLKQDQPIVLSSDARFIQGAKEKRGGHATLIVGQQLKDNQCQMLIRNSWGAGWGEPKTRPKTASSCDCRIRTAANQPWQYVQNCNQDVGPNVQYIGCWFDRDLVTKDIKVLSSYPMQ